MGNALHTVDTQTKLLYDDIISLADMLKLSTEAYIEMYDRGREAYI